MHCPPPKSKAASYVMLGWHSLSRSGAPEDIVAVRLVEAENMDWRLFRRGVSPNFQPQRVSLRLPRIHHFIDTCWLLHLSDNSLADVKHQFWYICVDLIFIIRYSTYRAKIYAEIAERTFTLYPRVKCVTYLLITKLKSNRSRRYLYVNRNSN